VKIASASGRILKAGDMHAHNTFENPEAVKIATLDVSVNGETLSLSIPAASVIQLEIALA
jgi:alpha-N-arabinofuranosidase